MKIESRGMVPIQPETLEEAALAEQHRTAVEQRKSARQDRADAQQDAVEHQKRAAAKLREMASRTIGSGILQAVAKVGTAACTLATGCVEGDKLQLKVKSLGQGLGAAANLDGFQWDKDRLAADKAEIEISQRRADQAGQRAGEEVQEARESASKIRQQIEDMMRIRHETAMATIRRG